MVRGSPFRPRLFPLNHPLHPARLGAILGNRLPVPEDPMLPRRLALGRGNRMANPMANPVSPHADPPELVISSSSNEDPADGGPPRAPHNYPDRNSITR